MKNTGIATNKACDSLALIIAFRDHEAIAPECFYVSDCRPLNRVVAALNSAMCPFGIKSEEFAAKTKDGFRIPVVSSGHATDQPSLELNSNLTSEDIKKCFDEITKQAQKFSQMKRVSYAVGSRPSISPEMMIELSRALADNVSVYLEGREQIALKIPDLKNIPNGKKVADETVVARISHVDKLAKKIFLDSGHVIDGTLEMNPKLKEGQEVKVTAAPSEKKICFSVLVAKEVEIIHDLYN